MFDQYGIFACTALLRRFVRNKGDTFCDEVELLDANNTLAHICYLDGRESTVFTSDLARLSDQTFTEELLQLC